MQEARGPTGFACATCHARRGGAFKNWAAGMPKWEPRLDKVLGVEEFVFRHAKATTGASWLMQSDENLAMAVYLRNLANGEPMQVDVASPGAKEAFERGKALTEVKLGQLNFSCLDCHNPQRGGLKWIRGQWLGEQKGQLDHFPTWRTSLKRSGTSASASSGAGHDPRRRAAARRQGIRRSRTLSRVGEHRPQAERAGDQALKRGEILHGGCAPCSAALAGSRERRHCRLVQCEFESMITRREVLQVGVAAAAVAAAGGLGSLAHATAQQRLTEQELLRFDSVGNVTLLHFADLHGQLVPVYFREPSVNLGVGEARGSRRISPAAISCSKFGIPARSADAYALTADDFTALAKSYGRIGGLDRAATVIKAVRAERGQDRVLLLDGGDTWQGSLGALRTQGQDMVDCVRLLKPDAMTGHWEFTYGEERVKELVEQLGFPFLALNMRDTEWHEPAFDAYKMFDKGGREDRGARPGVPLHAGRQSALDDAEMVVRHPRGGGARDGRQGAQGGRAARGAAVAQRLRRRPQARGADRRHRRDPHRRTPTTRCRRWSRSARRC